MSYMWKFIAFAKREFKTGIAYRFQFLSSIVISPLMLVLSYFIWQAVYNNQGETIILGYSFNDMITYYVLSMIVGHFIFNMVGNDIQEKILYGDLNQDLLKPFSVFSQFLSRTVADRAFAFIVEVIPVFIISFVIFKIKLASFMIFLLFLISIILSFFINFLINFLMGVTAFWLSRIDSLQWLFFIFIRFASGEFIPLDFLGNTLLIISRYLPFYYIRYGVIQIYIGKFNFQEIIIFFLVQLIWILVLYIFIRSLLKIALKKYGAQGG